MNSASLRSLGVSLLMTWTGLAAAAPPSVDGVTPREVIIGQTLPLSGPVGELGATFHAGYKAAIEQVNRKGGVHGRTIKLMAVDDGYVVQKSVESANKLVQDGVFLMSGCVGTANVLALMPVLAAQNVPLFAPYTGADAIQKEAGRSVFTVMAAYSQEVEKMVQHLSTVGLGKIAIVHQNSGFGKSVLAGTQAAMTRRNLTLHGSAAVESDASNAPAVAADLAKLAPQAVIVAAVGKPALEFIRAYRGTGRNAQFLLLSGTADINALGKELGNGAVGVIVTQTAPPPFSTRLKVAKEHREAMKAAGQEGRVNYTSMMGHIAASALVEVLRRTGRELTRDKFIAAAEGAGRIDLGGYELAFSRDQHHGSKLVDISMIRRGSDGFAYSY